MHFQISSKDDVGFLTESSVNSSYLATTKKNTPASSRVTDRVDTVHYLSPASTVVRSEHEGDLDYERFYVSAWYEQEPLSYRSGVFSSSTSTTLSCEKDTLQRTLAIIKPEALCYKDVVLRAIDQAGLRIVHERTVHLTPEQVSEIYEKYYGTPTFPLMVVTVSASPIVVLALQGMNAVTKWKRLIGPIGNLREEWFFPYSVKHRFGLVGDITNVLHASSGPNEARKENRYFYPQDVQEPLPNDEDKVKDYIVTFIRPALLEGLAEIVRTKPFDPVLSLAEWLLLHNPYQPKFAEDIAMTPT